jgi:hypothetical protein
LEIIMAEDVLSQSSVLHFTSAHKKHQKTPSQKLWDALKSGRPYIHLLREIASLRFSDGRLTFDEYLDLKLFDNGLYAGTDKNAFVGFKASQKIWFQSNYRVDLFALVNNKISADVLFSIHGLPTPPLVAMFHEDVGRQSSLLLRNDEELRAFLTQEDHYPLFGKPANGSQSIGSASLDRFDAAYDCVVTTTGRALPTDIFIGYVKKNAASGYLFQRRITPHANVREICGQRLATVRLLTIVTKGEPKIIRACWKISGG